MQAARLALEARFGVERWAPQDDGRVCAGCRYLTGRIFFTYEGPRPPLHDGCRCRREAIETEGLHGVAVIALALAARSNRSQAASLLMEARDRRREEAARSGRRKERR